MKGNVIYLRPDRSFYDNEVVTAGLTGFAEYALHDRTQEQQAIKDMHNGVLVPPSKTQLLRLTTHEHEGKGGQDFYGCDERVYRGLWRANGHGALLHARFAMRFPHYPRALMWNTHVITTATRASIRLHLVERTVRAFMGTAQGKSAERWRVVDKDGREVHEIIVPFTYDSDEWDANLFYSYMTKAWFRDSSSLVTQVHDMAHSEIRQLNNSVDRQQEEYERAVNNRPYLPDGKTWNEVYEAAKRVGGRGEYLNQLRDDITMTKGDVIRIKKQLHDDIGPLAEAQCTINKLTLTRGWKAALLGMMQAAELEVKRLY